MRVLVVSVAWPTPQHPHSGIFVFEQVESLKRAGVEVDVFSFKAGANPLNYVRARKALRRRLRAGSYDLVHAHFGQTGFAVPRGRLPLVVTFHGSDLEGIVGPSGRYAPRSHLLRRVSRAVARRASMVVLQSTKTAARLPAGVPYQKIPMGVDRDVFHPRSKDECRSLLGMPTNRKMVLFSGNPDAAVKRFSLAQRSVALLGCPDVDLVTMGGLSREAVAAYMSASDVLLVTSRHESGPVTVKEALACNLRVVSVDVGDVRDWIGGLQGCFVCSDDSPETIAAATRAALEDPAPLDAQSVARAFDSRTVAQRLIEVYRGVLQTGR